MAGGLDQRPEKLWPGPPDRRELQQAIDRGRQLAAVGEALTGILDQAALHELLDLAWNPTHAAG